MFPKVMKTLVLTVLGLWLVWGSVAGAAFEDIAVRPDEAGRELIRKWAPGRGLETYVAAASITATKPM